MSEHGGTGIPLSGRGFLEISLLGRGRVVPVGAWRGAVGAIIAEAGRLAVTTGPTRSPTSLIMVSDYYN